MTTPILRFDAKSAGVNVSVESLIRSRLLVQANSGGGKSHAIRALLEQTHGHVQQIVFDPEGEFSTLRERFGFVLSGKEGDVPAHPKVAKALCRRLLETNASAILDLYDLSITERREFVKLFLVELMALPRSLWRPLIVVIDEAHVFCPERGSGESQSTDAVITLCTQGRKRGFCAVLATQRISKLHKDAAAELLNKLIGRTGLDVDVKRAGDELGMDKEGRSHLRDLKPGEFFAFGPAIGEQVQRVRSADVVTTHPDANALGRVIPPPSASVQALVAAIGDLPAIAQREAQTVETLQREVKELTVKLRNAAKPGLPDGEMELIRDRARLEAYDQAASDLIAVHKEITAMLQTTITTAIDRMKLNPSPVGAREPVRGVPSKYPVQGERLVMPPKAKSVAPVVTGDASISRTMRRMLSVLVSLDALGVEWPEKRTMAGWSGVSHTTGTFSNQLRGLRDTGCIEVQGDRLRITQIGRDNADPSPAIESLDDLHNVWESKFSTTVARMFRALLTLSGPRMKAVSKYDLAEAVGVSHTTGTFSNQLREMRTPGVIEDVDKQSVRLTPLVFPEGLS